jgi:transcriptional regulator with XRE-family HTH domain
METVNGNTNSNFLSQNLRNLRKRMNLSQEQFAKRIGLNRGNIASYEKGSAEPKICNLLKMANLFGVSILDLTGRDLRNVEKLGVSQQSNGQMSSLSDQDKRALNDMVRQAEELDTVVKSIYNCHCFKVKDMDDLPKDVRTLISHFEQLHEVTHVLLQSHQEMLEFIRSKC